MNFTSQRLPARAALVAIATLWLATPARGQEKRATAKLPTPTRTAADDPKVTYTRFTLPNGLRVLLHEDHSSPIAAVELWYNVGSINEEKGKTGLAHLFEHMMFEGTVNMDTTEYDRTIQAAGGVSNAETSTEWTRYYSKFANNYLERVLWMEAERMVNTSPSLDSAHFVRARDAVRNEYGNGILTVATNMAGEIIPEVLFAGSSYGTGVMGSVADMAKETLADLRAFHEKFYTPNNAVLVIAGDIDPVKTRAMVTKQFGLIPRGGVITQSRTVAPLTEEKRLVIEHPSGQRQVWLIWQGAAAASPDRMATLALSSIITERMRRVLVGAKVAIGLSPLSGNYDFQKTGILQLLIGLTPTGSATEAERLADSVIASVRADGVTDVEVRRWIAGYRTQTLMAMQGVQTKAQNLADGLLNQDNPMGVVGTVDRAQAVRPADVLAVARKYMVPGRLVLSIVPTGKLEQRSKPELPYTNITRK